MGSFNGLKVQPHSLPSLAKKMQPRQLRSHAPRVASGYNGVWIDRLKKSFELGNKAGIAILSEKHGK